MPGSDPTDGAQRRAVSRRELIRRAAATGGALSAAGVAGVWSAPSVHSFTRQGVSPGSPPPSTTTSSTTTTTPQQRAGCFKYMFNWCWANDVQVCVDSGGVSTGFNQNGPPASECAQSLGENASGQIQSNPTCCQENDPGGNNLQWHEVPDFPASCVVRTGEPCSCPGATAGAMSVTFTITCPDCYFGDITVLHGARSGLEDVPAGTNCGAFSLSSSNTGGNPFTTSWTINFPASRRPIWFKFWVGCNLDICSPQIVPCTQSDCLPGPPAGQPVASRTLNI